MEILLLQPKGKVGGQGLDPQKDTTDQNHPKDQEDRGHRVQLKTVVGQAQGQGHLQDTNISTRKASVNHSSICTNIFHHIAINSKIIIFYTYLTNELRMRTM